MRVRIIVLNYRMLNYRTQHRTVAIIFSPNLQTIITDLMLPTGGERKMTGKQAPAHHVKHWSSTGNKQEISAA